MAINLVEKMDEMERMQYSKLEDLIDDIMMNESNQSSNQDCVSVDEIIKKWQIGC